MIKKFMLVFVALSFASPILLTGCNTVEGAGKDVESAGKAVKNEARENKKY
jgi:predicted small secreted protein